MAIICHCESVSDKTVRAVIAAGAESIPEIANACGAGRNCLGCTEALDALLANISRPAAHAPRWRRRHFATQTA